jgi:hypothetical protein
MRLEGLGTLIELGYLLEPGTRDTPTCSVTLTLSRNEEGTSLLEQAAIKEMSRECSTPPAWRCVLQSKCENRL